MGALENVTPSFTWGEVVGPWRAEATEGLLYDIGVIVAIGHPVVISALGHSSLALLILLLLEVQQRGHGIPVLF
jgi:hypothetical protein